MKICFLDNNPVGYSANDLYSLKIRGAENAVINLSNNLASLGNEIAVFNNTNLKEKIKGVSWSNIKELNESDYFDIAITNNDIRLLNKVNARKKFAISHSLQSIEKFFRKKQFVPYITNKPQIILLGKYHDKNRNIFLKIFGKKIVEWGVDDIFLNKDLVTNKHKNLAIFISRKDRNMDLAINAWKNYVFKKDKISRFLITPTEENLQKYNIFNRKFGDKNQMINDLINSKICIIPGHSAELFCIAAEEAKELCVPVVTLGNGSLSERVIHGLTGLIGKNEEDFGRCIYKLLNDNSIYDQIRKNLILQRGSKNWNKITKDFFKIINE